MLAGLANSYGKILSSKYRTENNTLKIYSIKFQKINFDLEVMLNKDSKFEYFAIKPQSSEKEVTLKRNISDFRLPFKGEWYVVWGGDTKEQNYHVDTRSQKHAFDILKLDSTGRTHSEDGSKNENYYAYGQDIIAPVSGKVVKVIDGVPDNKPGEMNPFMAVGNCIIIKTKHNEYLFLAHLQPGSILVKEGQRIKYFQKLAKCGNSGNSSEPHLHFHIQNKENMGTATGAKLYFNMITANGKKLDDYSPIQGDVIKNTPLMGNIITEENTD